MNDPTELGYVIGWKAMSFSLPGWIHTEVVKEVLPGRERWTARCQCKHRHAESTIPDSACTCGWYAWKHESWRADYGRELYVKLAMWGRVIEATDGYRSEFSYPLEIDVVRGTIAEPYVYFLQDRYGVPCRLVEREQSGRVRSNLAVAKAPARPLYTEDLIKLYQAPEIRAEDRLLVARQLMQRLYGMNKRAEKREGDLLRAHFDAKAKAAKLRTFTESVRECITKKGVR